MIFSFPLSPILSVFADLFRRYQCPNLKIKVILLMQFKLRTAYESPLDEIRREMQNQS